VLPSAGKKDLHGFSFFHGIDRLVAGFMQIWIYNNYL
jgi:hypothetical protein